MINVSLKVNAEKRYLRLRVRGHAGQSVQGQDIVCASASILAYTVAQLIKDMGKNNKLEIEPVIILKDGLATITCVCKTDEDFYEAFNIYDFANTGYVLLAHNYPQYVELNTVGKAD
jgi:uncharacterized protein YsxB (DUF464 family)